MANKKPDAISSYWRLKIDSEDRKHWYDDDPIAQAEMRMGA